MEFAMHVQKTVHTINWQEASWEGEKLGKKKGS